MCPPVRVHEARAVQVSLTRPSHDGRTDKGSKWSGARVRDKSRARARALLRSIVGSAAFLRRFLPSLPLSLSLDPFLPFGGRLPECSHSTQRSLAACTRITGKEKKIKQGRAEQSGARRRHAGQGPNPLALRAREMIAGKIRSLVRTSCPNLATYVRIITKKKSKFGHFLVVVQRIHRLTQADISCTTTARLFLFSTA